MKFLVLVVSFLFSSLAAAKSEIELTPDRTIVLNGTISNSIIGPMMGAMDKLAKTGKDIDIVISSPGGSVIAGSLIIDKMVQLKEDGVQFRCFVRGLAASMAFQLLLFCDERYSTPHSFLLWHPVRIFAQGVVTAQLASNLSVQLQQADEVALHDLRAHLPMGEADILMHFYNETLHQAHNLLVTAPGFFTKVTNSVSNLYPDKPALDTTELGGFFGLNQVVYIHEQFLTNGAPQ